MRTYTGCSDVVSTYTYYYMGKEEQCMHVYDISVRQPWILIRAGTICMFTNGDIGNAFVFEDFADFKGQKSCERNTPGTCLKF